MTRQNLLLLVLVLSVTVASLHFAALALYLYWSIFWFDMLVHFVGGLLMALLGVWVIFYSGYVSLHFSLNNKHLFYVALVAALIAGVGWEVFEFFTDMHDAHNYIFDTATDLLMDLLGAFGAYLLVAHSKWRAVLE